jgi:hypothetical protein
VLHAKRRSKSGHGISALRQLEPRNDDKSMVAAAEGRGGGRIGIECELVVAWLLFSLVLELSRFDLWFEIWCGRE